jgi:hypothetical protein
MSVTVETLMPQSLAASDKPTQFKSTSQLQYIPLLKLSVPMPFKFVSLTNNFMCKI